MTKVNIKDIAKASGVSIATVSRVLNKSAKKFKFKPNINAHRLASKSTDTIGLVIPRYVDVFNSYYALQVLQGAGSTAERLGKDLLVHITSRDAFLNLSSVDGVIFADIIGNEEQLDDVLDAGLPCVIMNYLTRDLPVSCIAIDNFNAAVSAVEYLISLGHSRIATITGELKTQVALERLNGYVRALEKNKLERNKDYIVYGDFGRDSGRKAAKTLISLKIPPTAVFCASDDMAVGFIEVCLENGIGVPKELSVIGFDDNQLALNYSPVPLTTIRQPLYKMSVIAAETLNQIILKKVKSDKKIILPTELIERTSCQQLS